MMGLTMWAGAAGAGDWPGWRGATGCGTTDETDLPLTWNGKSGEGIAWKAPLAGTRGYSSPIVWGDRVFITTSERQTADQEKNKEIPDHHFACFQASDGKALWQSRVAHGPFPAYMGAYTAPTPVTDGKASTAGSARP
jgi:outer membrane protein assembly factor BamB